MENKRILIIEDNEIDIIVARKIIELVDNSYIIDSVQSVKEAFQVLKNSTPDFILLDLILPIQDGFEFLKEISTIKEYQNIPIFIYSSSIHQKDIEDTQGYHNVAGFIHKPIGVNDFINVREKMKSLS